MSRDEASPSWRTSRLRGAAVRLNQNRSVHILARIGLAMKGVVYLTIGGIALSIALGSGGKASQLGALSAIATTGSGVALLWVATVGLAGLVLWQLSEAAWVHGPGAIRRFFRRLVPLAKALGFAGTGFLTLMFALGFRPGNRASMTDVTEDLLNSIAGQVIILAGGGILIGVGCAAIFRGVSRHFRDEVATKDLRHRLRRAVDVIGLVGYVAKGSAYFVAGGLLATALLTRRAAEFGFDGALQYLATLPLGTVLLGVVALGLATHGIYLIIRCILFPDPHSRITVRTWGAPEGDAEPLELR